METILIVGILSFTFMGYIFWPSAMEKEELKKLKMLSISNEVAASSSPRAEASGSLKQILKDFHNDRVKISEEDRIKNMKILQEWVLDKFITAMKEADPLFKELYKDNYYTGSYYDGLKVSDADEFDLNIRLELPFKWEDVQIVYNNVPAGYAQYKIIKPLEVLLAKHPKWPIYQKLTNIMEKEHLSQKKLNEWCQGVGDKALLKDEFKQKGITRSRHGPAFTLKIKTDKSFLDVDLVPVIKLNKYPPSVRKSPYVKPDSMAFIVPKPMAGNATAASNLYFRISMPNVEKQVMENKGCVKMLIRIFKVIRDNEKWKFFASYYIKTLFLWELEKHSTDDYWNERNLDIRFIEMLKQFVNIFEKKELKHFLFQNYNLISGINAPTMDNMNRRFSLYLDKSQTDLIAFKKLLYGN